MTRRPQQDDIGSRERLFNFLGKAVDKLFIFEPPSISDIGRQMPTFVQSGFDIREIFAKSPEFLIELEQILYLPSQSGKTLENGGKSARM